MFVHFDLPLIGEDLPAIAVLANALACVMQLLLAHAIDLRGKSN